MNMRILLILVLFCATAVPVYADSYTSLGLLPFGSSVSSGNSHVGPFEDIYTFEVPTLAAEFQVVVHEGYFTRGRLDSVSLWKGDSLLFQEGGGITYGYATYRGTDPLQLSYPPDYVSSLAGEYRLCVLGVDPFSLGSLYDVTAFANRISYIPTGPVDPGPDPVPEPGTLFLVGLGGIGLLLRARIKI